MIRCHSHASGAFFLLKEDGEGFDGHMRPLCRSSEAGQPIIQSVHDHQVDAFGSPVDHLDHLDPPKPDATVITGRPEPGHSVLGAREEAGHCGSAGIMDFRSSPLRMSPDVPDNTGDVNANQAVMIPFTQQLTDDGPIDDVYDDDDVDTDDLGWLVVDPHDASQNRDKPFRMNQPCPPKCVVLNSLPVGLLRQLLTRSCYMQWQS